MARNSIYPKVMNNEFSLKFYPGLILIVMLTQDNPAFPENNEKSQQDYETCGFVEEGSVISLQVVSPFESSLLPDPCCQKMVMSIP